MSRPILRLVEPLGDGLEFSIGKSEVAGLREIRTTEEIYSLLQLFLMWPEYSSSFTKIGGEMVKMSLSVDHALSDLDQLLLTMDENSFKQITSDSRTLEKVYIEVFGITFGFQPTVREYIDEYIDGVPCISLAIPETLTRYNMRGTRRVKITEPLVVSIIDKDKTIEANLIDASPNAFSLKVLNNDKTGKLSDRITISIAGNKFDVLATSSLNHSIIVKPILAETKHFGAFFDLYAKFAYPDLKSRFSFERDPIPELLTKTGQIKNYGASEVSETWYGEIEEAYRASIEVKDQYVAGYVSVDSNSMPVGTSSLAKVFIDQKGVEAWAFHGLGAVQDPNLISNTCSLYKWRVDYILAREPEANIVMWFNGRGKWLEKVYIKFQKLTSDNTKLWPIKHNRYARDESQETSNIEVQTHWKYQKDININSFVRYMATDSIASVGLGVPYLNYGGILNNIFFYENCAPPEKCKNNIINTVAKIMPKRFFIETPQDVEDIEVPNYKMFLVDVANRQCITNGEALKYFSSSLEHSQAVVKKKYGIKAN